MADAPIAGGGSLSYVVDGDARRPALLLAHALGTTRHLWNAQLSAFTHRFRVVAYDTRGHGASSAPPGEYTIEQLGRDVLSVLDAAGVERATICGASLGALTAIWLARHAPERVVGIILANTAARIGSAKF